MFPVPAGVGLVPELAVGRIDRPRVGLVALERLVDFPEFALGQARIFSSNWQGLPVCGTDAVEGEKVPVSRIQEECDRLNLPNLSQFTLKGRSPAKQSHLTLLSDRRAFRPPYAWTGVLAVHSVEQPK